MPQSSILTVVPNQLVLNTAITDNHPVLTRSGGAIVRSLMAQALLSMLQCAAMLQYGRLKCVVRALCIRHHCSLLTCVVDRRMSSREVQTSVRLVLPGELAKHAVSEVCLLLQSCVSSNANCVGRESGHERVSRAVVRAARSQLRTADQLARHRARHARAHRQRDGPAHSSGACRPPLCMLKQMRCRSPTALLSTRPL